MSDASSRLGTPPPPPPGASAPGAEEAPAPGSTEAEIAEVPHRLSDRVAGLTCPNCAGSLDVASGLRVVFCDYCRTPLLVANELGARRFAVEPTLGADRARTVAREWLSKGMRKDPKLRTEARIGEALLCFLPFFRVQADCLGIALGTELRRRTVGTGKNRRVETYEVDVERKVGKSHDRTYPAVDVSEWGIQRVDLVGDPLVPFDSGLLSRLGMVFEPTGSEQSVFNEAIQRFRNATNPAAGLKKVRFKFLETVRERLSVIYYPIWVVRYHYRERAYQILVDAQDGSLAYGKAPGNDFYRAAMLVLAEAGAAFVATTALQLAGQGCLAVAVVFGIGLSIVLWGWKHFRYGGVVIEGSGVVKPAKSSRLRGLAKSVGGRRGARLGA